MLWRHRALLCKAGKHPAWQLPTILLCSCVYLLPSESATNMPQREVVMKAMFLYHIEAAALADRPLFVEDEAIVIILPRGGSRSRIVRSAGGGSKGNALKDVVDKGYLEHLGTTHSGRYRMTHAGIQWCLENIGGQIAGR